MIDINTPLQKAFYDAIVTTGVPVYEGEEPDDLTAPIYAVIQDVQSQDAGDLNTRARQAQVTVSVHSWKLKYNNSADLNTSVGLILGALLPGTSSALDLTGSGLQMVTMSLQSDITQRLGKIGGREYISRVLIFNSKIVVNS